MGVGFAAWAFHRGCLVGSQPQIIQALIPLAAGVAAWAFYGSLHINTESLKQKVMVAATGGFAVWLGTAYMLVPKIQEGCQTPEQIKTTQEDLKLANDRQEFLSRIGGIRTIRGNYGFASAGSQEMAKKIVSEGPFLIQQLESINPSQLNPADTMHREAYIGLGYLYLGLAWDLIETNQEKLLEIAKNSISYSNRALSKYRSLIGKARPPDNINEKRYQAWLEWLAKDRYDQFLYQNLGRAYLLAYKAGAAGYGDAQSAFKELSKTYKKEVGLLREPILVWFCKKHPTEEVICT